ncbi:MAG: 2-C-methyl-D-erythritol 4-phosphate cytidylyltransferase [Coriobacteriales bacterium]|jgi:2-C-methyl-D-erythritol 4-phosphate cytidylyltransferase|nr:2-C-methyl-D-erythritol 4-phosphate cytidylyltransferase [Coriobacteriales bacterium]
MSKDSQRILLLMMGGSGTRFGADIPKQFIEIDDKPVFSYILEKYHAWQLADCYVIVCHEDWQDYVSEWLENLGLTSCAEVVKGGCTRSESVYNGLTAAARFARDNDVMLIHDATHVYVDADKMPQLVEATQRLGGATIGALEYDTVYEQDPQTQLVTGVIPRETVVSGASPEAFLFGRIWPLFEQATSAELARFTSVGALALANGIEMAVIPTDLLNLKITYRQDMEVFKRLFYDYYF